MAAPQPTAYNHRQHSERDGGYSASVETVETPNGKLQIEICETCHFIEATCLHVNNDWFDQQGRPAKPLEGYALICRQCGLDGT